MSPRPLALPDLLREVERVDRQRGLDTLARDGTGPRWHGDRDRAQAACDAVEDAGVPTWSLALMEEVYEALSEVDETRLRAELIQVATVALRWVRAIDERSGR